MQILRKYWQLAAYSCGIPILAYFVLLLVQNHQLADWMEAVKKDFPNATEEELAARSLTVLCTASESRKALGHLCTIQDQVTALQLLAVLTLGATLVLIIASYWAGQRCRRNRQLLLKLFRPSTHIMTVATLFIVISQAVLFVATLAFGPMEFFNRIPSGIIVLAILGVVAAVFRIIRVLFIFNKDVSEDVDGRFISAEQAPELWKFVDDTAASVGTERPHNIVVGTDPTFFVTEAKIHTDHGDAEGRTLYLSLPLCRILTRSELRAIVGHEMAHFHGEDTTFSRAFYPLFRRGTNTLEAIVGSAQSSGSGGFSLLPAILILSFYLNSFAEAEAEIGRERELKADAIGASITSSRDFAVALTKIIQHDSAWEHVFKEIVDSSTDKDHLPLPSELFRKIAEREFREADRVERIKNLEVKQLEHPFDSHPPLQVRLNALGFSVEEIYDEAGNIHLDESSSIMIPAADDLERELFPHFASKSEDVQNVFTKRQAGFAAIEFYALILNRSFLIYVDKEGLYGLKFSGFVSTSDPLYFESARTLLDDPWFTPGTLQFQKAMKESRASFFLPKKDINDVEFDSSPKWGMGKISHTGKLRIKLTNGKTREFVLLGSAYGDGICRVILETVRNDNQVA